MKTEDLLAVGGAIAFCLGTIALVCFYVCKKAFVSKVKRTSVRYKQLKEMHETLFTSYYCNPISLAIECSSTQQWKKRCMEIKNYLACTYFEKEEPKLQLLLSTENEKSQENLKKYETEYLPRFNRLVVNPGIQKKRYEKIEHDLLEKERLNYTDVILSFRVSVNYVSPGGRNEYNKVFIFRQDAITELLNIYADNIRSKNSHQSERSKMNDALRYDILKRDNFRCRICGRSQADGVTLEVDHIFPVSKGGKTEPSNLRTLCKECNRGKSDKVE